MRDLMLAFAALMLVVLGAHAALFAVQGTRLEAFLAPHVLLGRGFDLPFFLEWLYLKQVGMNKFLAGKLDFVRDMYGFSRTFFFVPLLEELEYRGPLWLLRRHARRWWWVTLAIGLGALFALGHQAGPLPVAPVFGVAIFGAWLIRRTGRFWPALVLHAAYNAQITFWEIVLSRYL